MVAAILVLFVALLIVLMGLSELVGKFMPAPLALWLGYLIVGGVTMFAGLWLAKLAINNLRNAGQFLTRTSRSLSGDFAALERELSSGAPGPVSSGRSEFARPRRRQAGRERPEARRGRRSARA
jgi:Putative Actinobacterial Holin-X, holin superfamily III